jgi:5-methylcytosine-specific restriction endonuclease McrA
VNDAIRAYNDRRNLDAERQKERSKRRRGLDPAFKAKCDAEDRCRNPDCLRTRATHSLERHHIVHRSLLGRDNPDRDHPDNGMALCHPCHQAHHTGRASFTRSMLSASEIAFILQSMGEPYLDRHFPEA